MTEKEIKLRELLECFTKEEMEFEDRSTGLFIYIYDDGKKAALDIMGKKIAVIEDVDFKTKGAEDNDGK